MQRTPTSWDANTAKNNGVAYSDASTTYSSPTTAYSSPTVNLDEFGKIASSWASTPKTATGWVPNSAATTNLYPFDSANHTYDSTVDTYDGIVTGQDFGDIQTPTQWQGL